MEIRKYSKIMFQTLNRDSNTVIYQPRKHLMGPPSSLTTAFSLGRNCSIAFLKRDFWKMLKMEITWSRDIQLT